MLEQPTEKNELYLSSKKGTPLTVSQLADNLKELIKEIRSTNKEAYTPGNKLVGQAPVSMWQIINLVCGPCH